MRSPARRRLDHEGFTLIELIVTVAIMGLTFVAVVTALGAAVKGSGRQRVHAALNAVLLSAAEDLRAPCVSAPGSPTDCPAGAIPYDDCATDYVVTVPAGFTASATVKGVWNRDPGVNRFDPDWCATRTDSGLQLIELEVSSGNAQLAGEKVMVVKRRP